MPVLSVRGDASLETAPDGGGLGVSARAEGGSTAEVLAALATASDAYVSRLQALGAVLATSGVREPLTYLRQTPAVHEVRRWVDGDEQSTGRWQGTAVVVIGLRDLALHPAVLAAAGEVGLQVEHGWWFVDDDNPGWAEVRAQAVRAAWTKADHYAAALGCEVGEMEHLADTGLLAGADGGPGELRLTSHARAAAMGVDVGVPETDPRPQVLRAQVEARFSTSGSASRPDSSDSNRPRIGSW